MDKQILLASATLRECVVEVCGQAVRYREPSALTRIKYYEEQKLIGKEKAVANFIKACLVDPELSDDEAEQIACGADRVVLPILKAILNGEDEEEAKKD